MEEPFEEQSREHKDHTITVKWYYDPHMGPPWEEHDGHGPVSEWTTRDKRAGERVLVSDRSSKRYYDFAEAVKLAKKDGWGISDEARAKLEAPKQVVDTREYHVENGIRQDKLTFKTIPARKLTRKEIAVVAVEEDFKYLKDWADDRWHWAGYVVEIDGEHMDSCWGIDSPSIDDRNGCGSEWTYEGFFKEAIEKIDKEEAEALEAANKEEVEALDAACRDVVTV